MDLIRGRWFKKYINCPEDKRDFDLMRRGFTMAHERTARDYCERFGIPEISAGEKSEIAEYWKQFGIKILDYSWYAMYYHVTGLHDPRFVPDTLAGLAIYPYYNDCAYEDTWRDKNMFDRLLPNVPFPKAYGKCIRNRYITVEGKCYERDDAGIKAFADSVWKAMGSAGEIIIKNSRNSGFGRGVEKFNIQCCSDVLGALLKCKERTNFIIQKKIEQHPLLARFNSSSTNMLRVCSWRHGNQVDILYAAVRAGVEGSVTDISFINGVETVRIVGINSNGEFSDRMLDQDGICVKTFPKGVKVPSWEKIKEIIQKNHLLVDNFDVIGWDFTIDEEGEPKCLEWNVQWPGTVFYQYANGPLFGSKTEEILDFLKNPKNRENYIPFYMQLK